MIQASTAPAKADFQAQRHHERFKRFVESRKLTCQECRGSGEYYIDYFPQFQSGPTASCEWCEGTGYTTPHLRGMWLRFQRQDKRT